MKFKNWLQIEISKLTEEHNVILAQLRRGRAAAGGQTRNLAMDGRLAAGVVGTALVGAALLDISNQIIPGDEESEPDTALKGKVSSSLLFLALAVSGKKAPSDLSPTLQL